MRTQIPANKESKKSDVPAGFHGREPGVFDTFHTKERFLEVSEKSCFTSDLLTCTFASSLSTWVTNRGFCSTPIPNKRLLALLSNEMQVFLSLLSSNELTVALCLFRTPISRAVSGRVEWSG